MVNIYSPDHQQSGWYTPMPVPLDMEGTWWSMATRLPMGNGLRVRVLPGRS